MNKPTRILVVDDNPGVLDVFSKLLRAYGYEVYEAATGLQGLQLTRERRPDLVLLDVILPDINGIEVCRQIKTDPALLDVFVVLVSGEAISPSQKVDGLEIGADEYIAKPLPMNEFLARIRTIVRLHDTTTALRGSERHYRRLVEILPDAVALLDSEGLVTSVNHRTVTMLGYADAGEVLGKSIFELIQQEDHRPIQAALGLMSGGGTMQNTNAIALRKDGSRFPVELSATVSTDADGQTPRLVLVARDITEPKWTERLLQVQRDFGIFLSSTNDLQASMERLLSVALEIGGLDCGAVYLADPETGALNLAGHRGLSGAFVKRASYYPPDSASARLINEGCPIYARSGQPISGIALGLKREKLSVAAVIPLRHGGRVAASLVLGSALPKELVVRSRVAIEAIVAQAGDAIARVRVEQSLRANRRLLEKTFHSIRAAVFVVDARTAMILECNPAATEIFGYTREEMIGQTTALFHVNKAMYGKFRAHMLSVLKEKEFMNDFEFTLKRKDGVTLPTEHSIMVVRNELGEIVSRVTVMRDITERKRAEGELRQIPQRIIEAQETERFRVARELHDGVNQIIAAAKMRLQKFEDTVGTLNPVAREMLARCYKLLVHALEENRRIAQNLRPSDLDEFGLAEACRNFCEQLESRTNLTAKCHITHFQRRLLPNVELNLFRIVQEACNNVEKHANAKNIQIRIAVQGGSILVRIRDDGRGFAPGNARPGKGARRGAGLTNMRERAVSLGGTCEMESAPNQGATITVRVPFDRGDLK